MVFEPRPNQSVAHRLRRFSQRLSPRISQRIDERLESVLEQLDRVNRSLAERAIPRERKERVKHRSQQSASSRGGRLRVVSRDTE